MSGPRPDLTGQSRHCSSVSSERIAPPRYLAIFAHGGQLQREDAAYLVPGIWMGSEENVSGLDWYSPYLNRLRRQAKHNVAAVDHLCPHIVQEIR
jgi:hypothetical protein